MSTRKMLLLGGAFVAVIAAAIALGVGAGNLLAERKQHSVERMRAAFTDQLLEQMPDLQPGDTLPNVMLLDLNRNLVSLQSQLSEPTLLVFFDYSCENCLIEMDHLAEALRSPGLAGHVVLVSASNPLYLLQLRDEQRISCPILYDDHMRFMDAVGVATFPFNLYLSAGGVIDSAIASPLGASDFERFSQSISQRQ